MSDLGDFLLSKGGHRPKQKAHAKKVAERVLKYATPKQRDFILDPSMAKAALCPRRAGKSMASLLLALHTAFVKPESKILIIAKVRRQVKGVYWDELLRMCRMFDIQHKQRYNELQFTLLDTGSVINFTGADTQEEIDKFRGQGYDLVIIDEGKSYSPFLLEELINEIIRPALMDRGGKLVMIGTPGAILAGVFYEVTTATAVGPKGNRLVRPWEKRETWQGGYVWSLHRWHSKDNVKMPQIWEAAQELKEQLGWPDDHPTWRREYLGEWVPDNDAMVYAWVEANTEGKLEWEPDFNAENFGLPEPHEWRYLLGVDLGYKDETAFVLAAWSETHPALYYIHAEKHPKLTVSELAERIHGFEDRFGVSVDARIADTGGLGAQIVHSLRQTYNLPMEAAKKTEKNAFIKLLCSDMFEGRIFAPKDSPLVEEWATLQWDNSDPLASSFRKKEDPGLDNHCADAALYLWRFAHHHWHRHLDKNPAKTGTKRWHAERALEIERQYAQRASEGERPWWKKFSSRWTDSKSNL